MEPVKRSTVETANEKPKRGRPRQVTKPEEDARDAKAEMDQEPRAVKKSGKGAGKRKDW